MGTGNGIGVVHPSALFWNVVDIKMVCRRWAVELNSGAVQDRDGCNSFLTDLWLKDVLRLSALDSKPKLMDSRIR